MQGSMSGNTMNQATSPWQTSLERLLLSTLVGGAFPCDQCILVHKYILDSPCGTYSQASLVHCLVARS